MIHESEESFPVMECFPKGKHHVKTRRSGAFVCFSRIAETGVSTGHPAQSHADCFLSLIPKRQQVSSHFKLIAEIQREGVHFQIKTRSLELEIPVSETPSQVFPIGLQTKHAARTFGETSPTVKDFSRDVFFLFPNCWG